MKMVHSLMVEPRGWPALSKELGHQSGRFSLSCLASNLRVLVSRLTRLLILKSLKKLARFNMSNGKIISDHEALEAIKTIMTWHFYILLVGVFMLFLAILI